MKSVWISVIAMIFVIVIGIEISVLNDVAKQNYFPQTDEEIDEVMGEITDTVERNKKDDIIEVFDDYFTQSMLGENTKDYFESFESDVVAVSVEIRPSLLLIIPAPDFLNSQEYNYNSNGELVKYTSISNTIGGSLEYYFCNNKLLATVTVLSDEEDIQLANEDTKDILKRADDLYNMYIQSISK